MAVCRAANLAFRDTERIEGYRPKIAEMIARHGGYVTAGPPAELLEGDGELPDAAVILDFPTEGQTSAWYNDRECAPLIRLRQTGPTGQAVLVECF